MSGNPGTCIDKQVTTDRTRVGYLALTYRGSAYASPGLTELVNLVHNAAKVWWSVLLQGGSHRKRNS